MLSDARLSYMIEQLISWVAEATNADDEYVATQLQATGLNLARERRIRESQN